MKKIIENLLVWLVLMPIGLLMIYAFLSDMYSVIFSLKNIYLFLTMIWLLLLGFLIGLGVDGRLTEWSFVADKDNKTKLKHEIIMLISMLVIVAPIGIWIIFAIFNYD